MTVPHTWRQRHGKWVLDAVPSCPWCGGTNEPLPRMGGKCGNSWHASHPQHGMFWTHPQGEHSGRPPEDER